MKTLALLVAMLTAALQQPPRFEVASIKPSGSDVKRVGIQTSPGGRFSAASVPLGMLITYAYRVQSFQVVGGPDWMNVDRFDIAAKGDENDNGNQMTVDQGGAPSRMQQMVQALLADRFKLVVRSESRDLPVYALVTKSEGKLGSELRRSTLDCGGPSTQTQGACGIRMGLGKLTIGGASMSQIASTLSGLLERTVVDRTTLPGTFDATLTWTPDQSTPGMALKAGYAPPGLVDPNGASIFTAVQEQLGLKLDSSRGPVNVIVVVSAQRPTAN